jgi:protein-tyrosine phosphatase
MTQIETIDRVISCRGIHNFRDYGGYATAHGRLRNRWLFRSGQHIDAGAEDLAHVSALGLALVIDLRGRGERLESPCPRPEGFNAQVVLIDEDPAAQAPHVAAARASMTGDQAREAMANAYHNMPFRPILNQLYTRYFERLAEVDGPSLIHCLAGKDRTGLAVALLHTILGVHPDDRMTDFLLTNTAGNTEERIAAGGRHIMAITGYMPDEAVRGLMSVEPAYLHNAFAAIDERYGNINAYLHEALGVTPERRDRLIENLTL